MAKETQKAKIERLEEELNLKNELVHKLNNEIYEFGNEGNEEFEKSPTFRQMKKRLQELEVFSNGLRQLLKDEEKKVSKLRNVIYDKAKEVERLEEITNENMELKIENSRLNAELGKQICEKSDLRKEIDALNKKIELDNAFYKDNETIIKKLDETLILNAKKSVEISKLVKEIEVLKNSNRNTNNSEVQETKNSRGAGRKSKFTEQEKQTIKMYRIQGKTIREIATMFECSVGVIHKVVNEN